MRLKYDASQDVMSLQNKRKVSFSGKKNFLHILYTYTVEIVCPSSMDDVTDYTENLQIDTLYP